MNGAPSLWQLAKNSVFLWVALVFVPVGAIFLAIGVGLGVQQRELDTAGQLTDATVLGLSIRKADFENNPRTRYLVRYRFTTSSGTSIEQTREVSVHEWERLSPGAKLRVRYLPSAPDSARAPEQSDWAGVVAFSVLALILLSVGVPLSVYAIRDIARQRRLSRTRLVVPATGARQTAHEQAPVRPDPS